LEKPGCYGKIVPPVTTPGEPKLQEHLKELIEKHFKLDQFRILLHIDEHPKMCARNNNWGRLFSCGAMQLWQSHPNITVVATHINPLDVLGAALQTAGVARIPVVLPSVDLKKLADACPELKFPEMPNNSWDKTQLRLWATLQLCLAMKFYQNLQGLHLKTPEIMAFLREFDAAKVDGDHFTRLHNCIKLCRNDEWKIGRHEEYYALDLLLGISERNDNLMQTLRKAGVEGLILCGTGSQS
jgi:hypothetical protein